MIGGEIGLFVLKAFWIVIAICGGFCLIKWLVQPSSGGGAASARRPAAMNAYDWAQWMRAHGYGEGQEEEAKAAYCAELREKQALENYSIQGLGTEFIKKEVADYTLGYKAAMTEQARRSGEVKYDWSQLPAPVQTPEIGRGAPNHNAPRFLPSGYPAAPQLPAPHVGEGEQIELPQKERVWRQNG